MSRYTFFMPSKGAWPFEKKPEYPECKVWDENTDLEKEFEEFQARYDALLEKRVDAIIKAESKPTTDYDRINSICLMLSDCDLAIIEGAKNEGQDVRDFLQRMISENLRVLRDRTP